MAGNQTFFNRAFGGALAKEVMQPVYQGGVYAPMGQEFTKPPSKLGILLNDVLNFATGALSDPYSPAGLAYGLKNVMGNRAANRQLQDQTQLALLNARQQADLARATGVVGLPDNQEISPQFDFNAVYDKAMPQQAKNNSVAGMGRFVQTGQQLQQQQYNNVQQPRQGQGVYVAPQKRGDISLVQLPLPSGNPIQPVNNYQTNNPDVLAGGVDYAQPQLYDPDVVNKAMLLGQDNVKNAYDFQAKLYSTDENNKNRVKVTGMNNATDVRVAGMNNNPHERMQNSRNNTQLSVTSMNNISRQEIEKERQQKMLKLDRYYSVLERQLENTYDEQERQKILENMQKVQDLYNQEIQGDPTNGNFGSTKTNNRQEEFIY